MSKLRFTVILLKREHYRRSGFIQGRDNIKIVVATSRIKVSLDILGIVTFRLYPRM
jgi:hypothetical protein